MEPLTTTQKQQLISALEALQTELKEFILGLGEATATVELDQGQQGRLSRIDAMQSQKMAQAHKQRATLRLERVQNVLSTADLPDFGCCGDCEEPIAFKRLLARPDAVLCVECAEERQR